MVTKEDARFFATKKDLETLSIETDLKFSAIRDDLQNFATKDDLKSFATKDDLKSFATKDDFFQIKIDLEDVKERMATKDDLHELRSEVVGHIDGIVKNYGDYQHEVVALHSRCDRVETRLQTVERKIGLPR
ncbi:hypothetical protein KKF05_05060 [Patescibacteria group bacterium]|nr:hypothetical protein [Patescibacteria group bacterium]MBU1029402.1 hypothetical protein [Patescibacteria group bacterium]MBU1916283.1 hypothetical protein [Patescibacteria group bacterium]